MATSELGHPDVAPPDGATREEPVALGQVLRIVAAAASLGAAAVHTSALADHSSDALHATVFIAMAIFQAWWAYLVLRSTATRVLVGGAVGHGAIVLLWLVSRTAGMPDWLPGATGREPVGLKDLAATVLAGAALAAVDLLTRRDVAARRVRPSRAGAAVGAVVLGAVVLAGAGAFAAGHDHSPSDPASPAAPGAPAHDH